MASAIRLLYEINQVIKQRRTLPHYLLNRVYINKSVLLPDHSALLLEERYQVQQLYCWTLGFICIQRGECNTELCQNVVLSCSNQQNQCNINQLDTY